MARRKEAGHGGGHGWFVTFADLMGLLVSFFVMLVAFSTQDQAKLQVVAGSMRDAFGVQDRVRYSGIIEVLGLPTRPRLKNAAHIDPSEASATPSPEENDRQRLIWGPLQGRPQVLACICVAAPGLARTARRLPKSRNTSCSRKRSRNSTSRLSTRTGVRCFPDGAKEPFERTRKIIQKIAPQLKAMPYRLSIVVAHGLKQSSAKARIWPMGVVG